MGWREEIKERGFLAVLVGDEVAYRVAERVAAAWAKENKRIRDKRLKREAKNKERT